MKNEKGIQLTAWQPGACSTGGHAYGYASPNGEGLNNQTIQRETKQYNDVEPQKRTGYQATGERPRGVSMIPESK